MTLGRVEAEVPSSRLRLRLAFLETGALRIFDIGTVRKRSDLEKRSLPCEEMDGVLVPLHGTKML